MIAEWDHTASEQSQAVTINPWPAKHSALWADTWSKPSLKAAPGDVFKYPAVARSCRAYRQDPLLPQAGSCAQRAAPGLWSRFLLGTTASKERR